MEYGGNLYMETAVPRPGRIRTRGVLLAVLLACAALVASLRHAYGTLLPFSPLYVQLPLYAALFGGAVWYLRRRLTAFRYTLTDGVFLAERLTGDRVVPLLRVPRAGAGPTGARPYRTVYAFTGRRRDAGTVFFTENGRTVRLLHSMSAELQERLTASPRD